MRLLQAMALEFTAMSSVRHDPHLRALSKISSEPAREVLEELRRQLPWYPSVAAAHQYYDNLSREQFGLDAQDHARWVRRRLATAGLVTTLAAEPPRPELDDGLLSQTVQTVLPPQELGSLAERAAWMAANLDQYLGPPPVLESQQMRRTRALLMIALPTMLICTILAIGGWNGLAASLALLAFLSAIVLLPLLISLSQRRMQPLYSLINRVEFYFYMRDALADPPETSHPKKRRSRKTK